MGTGRAMARGSVTLRRPNTLKNRSEINDEIKAAQKELADLELKRIELQDKIQQLQILRQSRPDLPPVPTREASQKEKIALFRSLFRDREDVFPRRFESKKTGRSGYQPVCRNEWVRPVCQKPKTKCGECGNRDFVPLSDEVIRNHLTGFDSGDSYRRE